jgi:hypothetical protein
MKTVGERLLYGLIADAVSITPSSVTSVTWCHPSMVVIVSLSRKRSFPRGFPPLCLLRPEGLAILLHSGKRFDSGLTQWGFALFSYPCCCWR